MALWHWLVSLFRRRNLDPASPAERREREVAAANADRAHDARATALPPVGGA